MSIREQDFSVKCCVFQQPYSIVMRDPQERRVEIGKTITFKKIGSDTLDDAEARLCRELAELFDKMGALGSAPTRITPVAFNQLIEKAEHLIEELAAKRFVISGDCCLPDRR